MWLSLVDLGDIHVPDADEEVLEVTIALALGRDDLVVLAEVVEGNFTVIGEVFIGAVEVCEEVVEFKTGLLDGFDFLLDLGVACGIELDLDFVQVEGAI